MEIELRDCKCTDVVNRNGRFVTNLVLPSDGYSHPNSFAVLSNEAFSSKDSKVSVVVSMNAFIKKNFSTDPATGQKREYQNQACSFSFVKLTKAPVGFSE